MTKVIAIKRNLRMSARKVRLVVNLVRKMNAVSALSQLKFINKLASKPVSELIKSAIANAEHNHNLKKDNLVISEAYVNQGTAMKRWRPRAFGRAAPIHKHMCHITVVLAEAAVAEKKIEKKETNDKKELKKEVKKVKEVKKS